MSSKLQSVQFFRFFSACLLPLHRIVPVHNCCCFSASLHFFATLPVANLVSTRPTKYFRHLRALFLPHPSSPPTSNMQNGQSSSAEAELPPLDGSSCCAPDTECIVCFLSLDPATATDGALHAMACCGGTAHLSCVANHLQRRHSKRCTRCQREVSRHPLQHRIA